jgi:hypothetical protein
MKISELRVQAQELGLSRDRIRQFGDLRKKSSWIAAINFASSELTEQSEPEPEILNIFPESQPEIWEVSQVRAVPENSHEYKDNELPGDFPNSSPEPLNFEPTETEILSTSPEVFQAPDDKTSSCKKPIKKPQLQCRGFKDFFVQLLSSLKACPTSQSELELLGRI